MTLGRPPSVGWTVLVTAAVLLAIGPATQGSAGPGRIPGAFSPLTATASAVPASGVAPLNVSFSVNASGGWPPYSYAWSFGDGAPNGSGLHVTHLYRWVGAFGANVTVTDSVGEQVTDLVEVVTQPAPLTISLAADPASVPVRNVTYLETQVQGGTPPYTYVWSGLPAGCAPLAVENLSCSPTEGGTYTIHVGVTDALGVRANATALLLVVGPSGGPGPTSAGVDWTLLILPAVAVLGIALVATYVVVRRRRSRG